MTAKQLTDVSPVQKNLLSRIDPSLEFLSVTEYAKRSKISRQAALERIRAGKVNAIKIGETWAIVIEKI